MSHHSTDSWYICQILMYNFIKIIIQNKDLRFSMRSQTLYRFNKIIFEKIFFNNIPNQLNSLHFIPATNCCVWIHDSAVLLPCFDAILVVSDCLSSLRLFWICSECLWAISSISLRVFTTSICITRSMDSRPLHQLHTIQCKWIKVASCSRASERIRAYIWAHRVHTTTVLIAKPHSVFSSWQRATLLSSTTLWGRGMFSTVRLTESRSRKSPSSPRLGCGSSLRGYSDSLKPSITSLAR